MNKWDRRFIELAKHISTWSKDPSTQVGAVLVGKNKEILSVGFNGFPRNIADTDERLNNRPVKYELIVHAEINAIMNAARNGINTNGSTMYVIATNLATGKSWGGAPCIRCSAELINAGIAKVVVPEPLGMPNSWKESCEKGKSLIQEAGILYEEV